MALQGTPQPRSTNYQPRLEAIADPKLVMEIQGATGRSCAYKYKMA